MGKSLAFDSQPGGDKRRPDAKGTVTMNTIPLADAYRQFVQSTPTAFESFVTALKTDAEATPLDPPDWLVDALDAEEEPTRQKELLKWSARDRSKSVDAWQEEFERGHPAHKIGAALRSGDLTAYRDNGHYVPIPSDAFRRQSIDIHGTVASGEFVSLDFRNEDIVGQLIYLDSEAFEAWRNSHTGDAPEAPTELVTGPEALTPAIRARNFLIELSKIDGPNPFGRAKDAQKAMKDEFGVGFNEAERIWAEVMKGHRWTGSGRRRKSSHQ